MQTLSIVLAIVIGTWEVVARVVPTVNNWSGTALVLKILTFLSDLLNNEKKVK